ncbi:MAG: type I DNA topoisomerase [Deltaproteobacteria bacterium]|nr:type I DNA topoisomerase [Deltaproteobacteria bacterium]
MARSLVIVESPAKARTIAGFLGNKYVVESSIGHIRDLPKRAADIPAEVKNAAWSRLGVDVENDFRPLYIVDPDKRQHITKLKKLIRESDEVLLATDEDREGESIAWHLFEVLEPRVPVKRMVFHEITPKAIEEAIQHPRTIDRRLVDAQEARRILDRLYGYEVSPVLWKKVMPKLSAGRVQSVATRIVVERERERIRFVPAGYWDIEAELATTRGAFTASSVQLDGARIVSGKDFGADGKLKGQASRDEASVILPEAEARKLAEELTTSRFTVTSLVTKPYRRSPMAPFMTSTLQQEAGRKLRFSSSRTMRAAQRLYENGYITYMRTDSTTLSDTALDAARRQIRELYGTSYLPNQPRLYKRKVKNAQEAHEAIRPAGDRFRTPEQVEAELGPDERRIYELVWKRTLASQMEDAVGQRVQVRVTARTPSGREVVFSASGNTITFPGFLRAYVEGSDDPEAELEEREKHLPEMREGEALEGRTFTPHGHETQPPARYTEASLVQHLEELGVGRPSTYASIINTIVDRGYVWKKGTALVPSFTAFSVVRLLEEHFGSLIDYEFTARMEDDLDEIANGERQSLPWLQSFYFGKTPKIPGLRDMVSSKLEEIDARNVNTLVLGKDAEDREVVVRVGRFGPYLQRGESTANLSPELAPDEVTLKRACELLDAPSGNRVLGVDPDSGLNVLVREGRFGAYVQLGEDMKEKPKTQSLLGSMRASTLTLEDALRLLSLPRVVGNEASGREITAHLGRYGAYIACGEERRSLESEEHVFSVTTDEASRLLAEPRKMQRRQAVAALREFGADPVSGTTITLRQGRFGLYVTDGETNASLRSGDVAEEMTPERAQELLQLRRDAGGTSAGKKTATKAYGKKFASKSASAEATGATTKKATAKKAATKKAATKKAATKKAATKASTKKASD